MKVCVGLDVAKEVHRACAVDQDARPVFSRGVNNDPDGIAELMSEIEALDADEVTVALDLIGSVATLVCAMVAAAGFRLVHVPGLSANWARQGMRGGENKSDPQDAHTIAELARTRRDLCAARAASVAKKVTRTATHLRSVPQLVADAIALARAQTLDVPGTATRARLVRELAAEALAARDASARVDRDITDLLSAHPDAALIQSLPGMGVVLTAELIANMGDIRRFRSADALAAASGLSPVLRQSGKSCAIRRANSGDKTLKRVFYQSSFVALGHPERKAFHDRKRREGKRNNQAVIDLARRHINVVWAIPTTRQPFRENFKSAA